MTRPASDSGFPAAARAFEDGDLDEAQTLLTAVDDSRLEARLLRARLLARQGEGVAALRELEAARADAPEDGRVFAAAAEMWVEAGKLDAARDEIRRGLAVDGGSAPLERAQGVYLLELPGGAPNAVKHLERALELDPELPFAAGPLARAHLRAGRISLREEQPLEAVRSARAGLALYPENVDLRLLHADALLAVGSFRTAAEAFEELFAEGHTVADDLALASWRAGMADLVTGDRASAIERFVRARELGMTDEALGSAAELLHEESFACLGRGVEAFRAGRLDEARDLFAEALWLEPGSPTAANHLAVCHAKLGMLDLAVEGWTSVLAHFDEAGTAPPEPVHLNLARVLLARGEVDRTRRLLEHYEPAAADRLAAAETSEELHELVVELEASHVAAALKKAE